MSRVKVDPLDVMTAASSGITVAQAADRLGCTPSYIYMMAKELGVTFTKRVNPRRVSEKDRARVRELRAQGWTCAQIAADVGLSGSWVAMFLRGER